MTAQNPKILIAGACGFLGSKLTEALLAQNCQVFALDTKPMPLKNPRLNFLAADINRGLPELPKLDFIFHLAGVETHALEQKEVGLNTLQVNSRGTANLLEKGCADRAGFVFASSIEVYLGVLSSLNLDYYFGTTLGEERRYSLAEAKRFGEALVWEYHKRHNLNATIVRLSEIYGPGMNLKSSGSLGRLLESAGGGEDLTVFGDGLKKEYYSFVSDVVYGLYKIAFTRAAVGKIYPLCELRPVTTLELAYLIQSLVRPQPNIIFKPPLEEVEVPQIKIIDGQTQKHLGWKPKVSLKEGLAATLESLAPARPALPPTTPAPPSRLSRLAKFSLPRPKRAKTAAVLAGLALCLAGLFYPAASFGLNAYLGYRGLNDARNLLNLSDPVSAARRAQTAGESFKRAKQSLEKLAFLSSLTKKEDRQQQTVHLLNLGGYLSQSLVHLGGGLEPLRGGEPTELVSHLPQLLAKIAEAGENLAAAEAEWKAVKPEQLPGPLRQRLETLPKEIKDGREALEAAEVLIKILPQAGGFDRPRKYLLLLQNSNELRPTGGFIGSYGTAVVDRGRLADLKIDDIYNLDGQLDLKQVHLEPPEALKEHLGLTEWRIRDANWAADFSEAAQTITGFYRLAADEEVDGIAALDLFLIENLLKITGPVYLAEQDQKVTAENLFERAEFAAEAEFVPGSPNKKTFLSLVGEKLFEKALGLYQEKPLTLIRTFHKGLSEKHLLLYFNDPALEAQIGGLGWGGQAKRSEGDFLSIIDANVGATKANREVRRSAALEIKNVDRGGAMENTLSLNYVHSGKENKWPSGPYKNYLRVFVPYGSTLIKSEGNQLEVATLTEGGRTVFATAFTLDAGNSLALKLTYRLPSSVYRPLSSSAYTIFVQKQPGTGRDPVSIDFYIPFGRDVEETPPGWQRNGDLLKLSANLERDLDLVLPLR